MSNNMVDKNVSDKVVWENGVTPDNDFGQTMSQPQPSFQSASQPQMMFCYKCNNVVPTDSKYCPYCKVKLYTICPKCGQKYSSQYPICNQCGTNRQEYLELYKIEQERKAAIERENKRQREIQERKRLEEERKRKEKEAIERARRDAVEREERAKDEQARIEAAPIRDAIIKKCNWSPTIKFIVFIWVILCLLFIFVEVYFAAYWIGWTIIGGIWANIKIRADIEKEIQEWRNNHPGDRRGHFLNY